jgi:hydroxymethylbilane synthase
VTWGMGLTLGTRGSLLARTQSRWVASQIEAHVGTPVELRMIRTAGDADQDRPLSQFGGKGLFTKELDHALLDGAIDLAVHSLKDLPTTLPPGLSIGAVPEREDPRDVLVGPEGSATTLDTLPSGARVGTSSPRRAALLRIHRPDLEVADLRGNLDTRIRKVDQREFSAIVLAAAGMKRLGWGSRISEYLEPGAWLPAPGQGALAVVVRTADLRASSWLEALEHPPTRVAVTAEREVLRRLEAGCQLPVGALGLPFGGGMRLRALVAGDGPRLVRAEGTGTTAEPEELGRIVSDRLVDRGADLLLGGIGRRVPDAESGRVGRG